MVEDNRPLAHQLSEFKDKVLEVDDENYVRSWNSNHVISRWLNGTLTSEDLTEHVEREQWYRLVLGGVIKP